MTFSTTSESGRTSAARAQQIADELVPLFYGELERLARRECGQVRAGTTLQTTVLVNEAYLKLRSAKGWNDAPPRIRRS